MILTHESGAQEDQFDGKNKSLKISWYYPFKVLHIKIEHSYYILEFSQFTVRKTCWTFLKFRPI